MSDALEDDLKLVGEKAQNVYFHKWSETFSYRLLHNQTLEGACLKTLSLINEPKQLGQLNKQAIFYRQSLQPRATLII